MTRLRAGPCPRSRGFDEPPAAAPTAHPRSRPARSPAGATVVPPTSPGPSEKGKLAVVDHRGADDRADEDRVEGDQQDRQARRDPTGHDAGERHPVAVVAAGLDLVAGARAQ